MITERSVEIPWLRSRLATINAPQTIIDVGSADSTYHWDLIRSGAIVTFQDVRPFHQPYHPTFLSSQGHTIHIGHPPFVGIHDNAFTVATCISVLDHVGLQAYGQPKNNEALSILLAELQRIIQPRGHLLFTVPVGDPSLSLPHQRLFSEDELLALFPYPHWQWMEQSVYRLNLVLDQYQDTLWDDILDARYLESRAEAVACIHLRKCP